jgi:lipopolysaccharide export system ATP-binding protein
MQNNILEAKHLSKFYKKRPVVKDVSIRIAKGQIVALLGPNGAGKTTCFNMIAGLVVPDSGSVFIDGEDITKLPMHMRAKMGLGYLPQGIFYF